MASIEDKITRTMEGTTYPNVARVVSPRAAGSDTLMADGLNGWSTETAMNFITYRTNSAGDTIEGTVRDWLGVVNKANNSIINLKLLAGPEDDGNNVGDIVQPCASASYADRLAQALLEILDTTGKPRPKAIPLAGINGGTTAGILKTDESGVVTPGKITPFDIESTVVLSGVSYVQGNGTTSNKKVVTFSKPLEHVPTNIIITPLGTTEVTNPESPSDFNLSANNNPWQFYIGGITKSEFTVLCLRAGNMGNAKYGFSWAIVK